MSRHSTHRIWRPLAIAFFLTTVAAGALLFWWIRQPEAPTVEVRHEPLPRPVPVEAEPVLRLEAASFEQLPGWREDPAAEALPALRASCRRLLRLPAPRPLGPDGVAGTAGDWRPFCSAVGRIGAGDHSALRALVEQRLRPWSTADGSAADGSAADGSTAGGAGPESRQGLFTGYYEPTLRGSRRRQGAYTVPLYRRPNDMLSIDLGSFREEFAGRRLTGRLEGRKVVPFHDRQEIDAGALGGRGLELAWVDDPVAAFFLHIQGSGRVELAEGGVMRVGYAGQNGHPYYAIGRELVARGELAVEEVSLQSIRAWLHDNPREARQVLHTNPSYIFFRELKGPGPLGSEGTALTPGRSLAVDRSFHAMGVPMWLDSTYPQGAPTSTSATPAAPQAEEESEPSGPPLQRLLVAQDTGGAIHGPVRGDVFWGPGAEAEEIAGRMRQQGRLWVLLPRSVTPPAEVPVPATEAENGAR
ncbi:MAG: MltA domain-containing protein [Acidobacteriota bacterium]|nr:MltA domain-containing protein [Acidobacteriota bacterium]